MNSKAFVDFYCKKTTAVVTKDDFQPMVSELTSKETIRKHLVRMSHKDFLTTRYWKIVSAYMRFLFPRCECGKNQQLHVHHKTYKYLGIEHLYTDSLQVLCQECHSLIHSCDSAPKSKDRGVGYSINEKQRQKVSTKKPFKSPKHKIKPYQVDKLRKYATEFKQMINSNKISNDQAVGLCKIFDDVKNYNNKQLTQQGR